MDRYRVVPADEVSQLIEDYEPSGSGYYEVLVDIKRNVVVYEEGHPADNPEDYYLYRNLGVFVRELNRLAGEPV